MKVQPTEDGADSEPIQLGALFETRSIPMRNKNKTGRAAERCELIVPHGYPIGVITGACTLRTRTRTGARVARDAMRSPPRCARVEGWMRRPGLEPTFRVARLFGERMSLWIQAPPSHLAERITGERDDWDTYLACRGYPSTPQTDSPATCLPFNKVAAPASVEFGRRYPFEQ